MKKQVLLIAFLTLNGISAFGQIVSFGAKGGAVFTDPTGPGDESRRYIVGPSVEVQLPAGFGIEADALYQRLGNTSFFGTSSGTIIGVGPGQTVTSSVLSRSRGTSWDFPVLGKYYFRPRTALWQPYLGTGWSLRTVGSHDEGSETVIDANGVTHQFKFRDNFRTGPDVGAVFAAGVRFHAGRIAVLPEVRYTRRSPSVTGRNEAAFLLGINF